jgi:hypothetical protein
MTQIEALKIIASYDGWKFRNSDNTAELYDDKGEFIRGSHIWKEDKEFRIWDYMNDLNVLIEVGEKVHTHLIKITNINNISKAEHLYNSWNNIIIDLIRTGKSEQLIYTLAETIQFINDTNTTSN